MRKIVPHRYELRLGRTVAALVVAAIAAPLDAGLVAYEGFNYAANTSLAAQTGGGSTGFASEWTSVHGGNVTVESGSLSHGGLVTSGGKVYIVPTFTTTLVSRSLSSGISSGVTYIGVLAQIEAGTRHLGLALHDSGSERLLIGKQGGQTDWSIGASAVGVAGTGITDTSTQSLLVVRIAWDGSGAEDIRLWVNPTPSAGEPLATTADAVLSGELTGFNGIRVAAGYNSGSQTTATGWIDEVRIGTSWADVTPVPEPTALGVFSLCGALALKRRRA